MVFNESWFSLIFVGLFGLDGVWLFFWIIDWGWIKMMWGLLIVKIFFWLFFVGCMSDFWRLRIWYNIYLYEVMMKKRLRKRRIVYEWNNIWVLIFENSFGMEYIVIVWFFFKVVNGINIIVKE